MKNWFQSFAFKLNLYRYTEDGYDLDAKTSGPKVGAVAIPSTPSLEGALLGDPFLEP